MNHEVSLEDTRYGGMQKEGGRWGGRQKQSWKSVGKWPGCGWKQQAFGQTKEGWMLPEWELPALCLQFWLSQKKETFQTLHQQEWSWTIDWLDERV